MKTKELGSLNTSNETLRTQEKPLSKAVRIAMDSYSERELNLLDNPFAESKVKVSNVLDITWYSNEEEKTYELWQLLWLSHAKLQSLVERDRKEKVEEMLAQFWLWTKKNTRSGWLERISLNPTKAPKTLKI